MAYSERLVRYSHVAGTSVVQYVGVPGFPGSVDPNIGSQYTIVKRGATKDVVELATASTDVLLGVTTTKAQHANTAVAVAYSGTVPVQAGEPLDVGDVVTAGAGGKAMVWSTGSKLGTVVEAASAAGVLATVQLELGR